MQTETEQDLDVEPAFAGFCAECGDEMHDGEPFVDWDPSAGVGRMHLACAVERSARIAFDARDASHRELDNAERAFRDAADFAKSRGDKAARLALIPGGRS